MRDRRHELPFAVEKHGACWSSPSASPFPFPALTVQFDGSPPQPRARTQPPCDPNRPAIMATPTDAPAATVRVALVGNPNTGKSTLFNALAGMHVRTGNYPGVTIEKKIGRCDLGGRVIDLVDLPGTYSLAATFAG